jgi:hypothetical protein
MIGETSKIVGSATTNANDHALSQIEKMPSMNPILNTLLTSDIMPDMNKAIKNEKT